MTRPDHDWSQAYYYPTFERAIETLYSCGWGKGSPHIIRKVGEGDFPWGVLCLKRLENGAKSTTKPEFPGN